MNIGYDVIYALPEGFLVLTRSFLLVIGAILGTNSVESTLASGSRSYGSTSKMFNQGNFILSQRINRMIFRSRRIGSVLCWISIDITSTSTSISSDRFNNQFQSQTLFNGSRVFDSTSQAAKAILLLSASLCRLGSAQYSMYVGRHRFEYPWRIGVSTRGLLIRVSSNDLIAMYLGLEWSSLCFYVLAAVRRGSAYSTEAGLKYFIMGALSSGIYLFGASLVYGMTGSLDLGEINRISVSIWSLDSENINTDFRFFKPTRRIGYLMVRIAFLFKLAIAPFHAWSPDVYEGSPTSSSLYFAVVPKLAIVIILLRLIYGLFGESFNEIFPVRRVGILISRSVATLAAIGQRRMKRFRAYSAIGHMGYLIIGISCGTLEGIQSARLYVRVYIVMSRSAWIALIKLGSMSVLTTDISSTTSVKFIRDLNGLHRRNSFRAVSLSIAVRSMAGIPPRAGFIPKLWVFMAAISEGMVIMSLFAVLTSCVGAYYYLRWIKIMYFDGLNKASYSAEEYGQSSNEEISMGNYNGLSLNTGSDDISSVILSFTSVIRIVMMLFPTPIILRCHRIALSIII